MLDLFILGMIGAIGLVVIVVLVRVLRPRPRPPSLEQVSEFIADARDALESWPSTEAQVVASRVAVRKSSGMRFRASSVYEPEIEVKYEVNGREIRTLANAFTEARSEQGWADNVARMFPAGRRVEVRYDPARPDIAFLDLDGA